MQSAAVATGEGTSMYPTQADTGAFNTLTAQVKGITTVTITWQGTIDGTNWVGFLMAPTTTGTGALTATADGVYRGTVTGFREVRANITGWTMGATTVTGVLSNS